MVPFDVASPKRSAIRNSLQRLLALAVEYDKRLNSLPMK
jgi:hypothetical protein